MRNVQEEINGVQEVADRYILVRNKIVINEFIVKKKINVTVIFYFS